MQSTNTFPIPARSWVEGGISTFSEDLSSIEDYSGNRSPPRQPPDGGTQRHAYTGRFISLEHDLMPTSAADVNISGHPGRGDDVTLLARSVQRVSVIYS